MIRFQLQQPPTDRLRSCASWLVKLRHSKYQAQTLGLMPQQTSRALPIESPFYPENKLKIVWANKTHAQTIAAAAFPWIS
jgi:hypothetical protein